MKYVAATSIYLHIYLIADIEVSREERNMYASIRKDINDSARVKRKRSMDVYFLE